MWGALKHFLLGRSTFFENLQNYDEGNQDEILARIKQEIQNVSNEKQ
jgi:hypothetical protein